MSSLLVAAIAAIATLTVVAAFAAVLRRRFKSEVSSEVVDRDFKENAVYLPRKAIQIADAPTSAGRIHRYAKTTSRRAGP